MELDIDIEQVVWEPTQDVVPDVVSGWTFGDAIGIGLRARNGWWSVYDAQITHPLKEVCVRIRSSTAISTFAM